MSELKDSNRQPLPSAFSLSVHYSTPSTLHPLSVSDNMHRRAIKQLDDRPRNCRRSKPKTPFSLSSMRPLLSPVNLNPFLSPSISLRCYSLPNSLSRRTRAEGLKKGGNRETGQSENKPWGSSGRGWDLEIESTTSLPFPLVRFFNPPPTCSLPFLRRTLSMLSSGSTSPNSLLLSSTSNSSASTSSSAHSSAKSGGGGGTIEQEKKWKLEEEREQLDELLESAFGYDSIEKAAWVEVSFFLSCRRC